MEIDHYIKMLQEQYDQRMHEESKMAFIGEDVFDFTVYSDEIAEVFATLMLEVVSCILNKTTFEYQEKNYINYLMMVNMPFLKDKLEWGTSIRGAWFDYYKKEGYEILGEKIPAADLETFMRAVLKWVQE